ncbi:SDR family oxidoreductase [Algoriphagus sp.]|uniref:SDR family oxidoreductase n=1 Tax=Algoriphagus sp. TaxID=1872435 RepID=UPI00260B0D14|nr:SDR family oxidoreductase [Algoriphagus sp.]
MDLRLTNQRFLVCGASSGLGEAVARMLLNEGARVVLVARRGELLREKFADFMQSVELMEGTLTSEETRNRIFQSLENQDFHGIFLNAGGPPTGTPLQTTLADWDEAWQLVMRWKIDLSLRLAPFLVKNGYGRILFLESQSVKQPLPALTLSNAFRAGVVGFAKSLALELASSGVTVNVLAPGSHDTPAIERVIKNKSITENLSFESAKKAMERNIPMGRMGKAEELASLAVYLLSPQSSFITGQTISHDGGSIAGIFG